MKRLTINGRNVETADGSTVLEAATATGIEIPTLCHHESLKPVGSCRLCLVEVDGWADPVAACVEQVRDGMVIDTESATVVDHRRQVLEMLLSETEGVPDPTTEFGRWVDHYSVDRLEAAAVPRQSEVDADPNPFIRVNLNACILCTRCVRACDEIQGRSVWGIAERGAATRLIAGADTTMLDARCESCGLCAAVCPTDALVDRHAFESSPPEKLVRTTCAYCGVGCQFDLNVRDDRITRVTSTPDAPVNGHALCVKGRYGWDFVHHPDRLTQPRVRRYLLDDPTNRARRDAQERTNDQRGEWVDVDWDTALDIVSDRLAGIRSESGSDALGVFSSAKCSNEENYLMQKLARQVLGTHNVDHCARLCHSSTVAGLAMAFGSGAMSNSMDDIAEHSQAAFIIGSNTTEQHPVFGAMIRQAVKQRGMKLVVADPRKIDITEFATLHLRQHPGTDVALINGLMKLVLDNNWHDADFIADRCEDFDEFAGTVSNYDAERVSEITGVPVDQLHEAAEILGTTRPMSVIWSMGITQHTTGVINVLSLANLQMLLGNMGVPGGGVNPLRGQNNVQGACDLGALPNVFPAYQAVSDAACRKKFSDAWELDSASGESTALMEQWSDQPGLTVTEMVDEFGSGGIRGLYILGENPVLTDPDSNHVRACLETSEFLVLQEIFPSETSRYADVLLPGVTFAERTGTFTNTERRVQLFHEAISANGNARPDWQVISDVAGRVLSRLELEPSGPQAAWDYSHPAEIMDEVAAIAPSYAGISHERLDHGERLQWPVKDRTSSGTPILHVGRFVRGRGRFHAVDHLPPDELPDADYPLLLTTGRVLYHWHGGEMTRRSRVLSELCPEPVVEVSHEDAARLAITSGAPIQLDSRRGTMTATAAITERVAAGLVFANFHFPNGHNANVLTNAALDPTAKIPEYKVCAVRMQPLPSTEESIGR